MVIPERIPNSRESEDSPTSFFRLMLPLVTGCIFFPVLISFYLIAMLNRQKRRITLQCFHRASFNTLDL